MPGLRRHCIAAVFAAVLAADAAGASAPPASAWLPDTPPPDADALPPGAVGRLGSTRFKHRSWVRSVAVSADGRTVASASSHDLILWDAATGRAKRRYRSGTDQGIAIAAGDDVLAAVNHTTEMRLIHTATGRYIPVTLPDRETFSEVAISLDDAVVAVAATPASGHWGGRRLDGPDRVILWDARRSRVLHTLCTGGARVLKVALSPDGNCLAEARDDRRIHIWDVKAGRELSAFPTGLPAPSVSCLAFSPTGASVGVNDERGEMMVLNAETGEELCGSDAYTEAASHFAFSPDGRFLAAAQEEGLGLYDVAGGREVLHLDEPGNRTTAVAFSRDGKTLVTGGDDRQVRLWDIASRRQRLAAVGHTTTASTLVFSPNSRALASSNGRGFLYVWDVADGRNARRVPVSWHLNLTFDPHGRRLATALGTTFTVWNTDPARPAVSRKIDIPNSVCAPLAFTQDGRSLVNIEGRDLVWRNAGNLSVERRLSGRLTDDVDVRITPRPGGALVAVFGQSGAFRISDEGGREVARLEGVPTHGEPNFVASPDGRRLALRDRTACIIWDLRSRPASGGQYLNDVWQQTAPVAFSADGRLLAGRDQDWRVRVLETASGREVLSFPAEPSELGALAFSPDGRILASAEDSGLILVWGLTGRRPGPQRSAPSVAELAALWHDLAGNDAARAYRAVWRLAEAPAQAVPFLRERLKPAEPSAPERVRRLVAELDDYRFARRQAAFRELSEAADVAEPELRRAIQGQHSAEAGEALRKIIRGLDNDRLEPTGERLRALRAVQALEYMRTSASREFLEHLADGSPGATLRREARAAIDRLGH